METLSVFAFTAEYVIRVYTAPVCAKYLYSRRNFIFSFYGIVDFLAIAPFYSMIVLEAFHIHFDSAIFRVLRVFRMLELERFVPAFTLLKDVYRKSKDVLSATGILALIIWVGGSTLFYIFQPELFENVPNAMYYTAIFLGGEWGMVDYNIPNKIVTMVFCIVAIALFSIPVATLFEAFGDTLEDMSDGLDLYVIVKVVQEKNGKKYVPCVVSLSLSNSLENSYFRYKLHVKGIEFSDRVVDIKKKIQNLTGIYTQAQTLIYQGNVLDNDSIVGRLYMKEGSFLRLEVAPHVFEKLRNSKAVDKMELI